MKLSSLRGSGVTLASASRKPRTSASDIARVFRGFALGGRIAVGMTMFVAQAAGGRQGFPKPPGALHLADGSRCRGLGKRNAVRGGHNTASQSVAARPAHPDRGDLPAERADRAALLVHRCMAGGR